MNHDLGMNYVERLVARVPMTNAPRDKISVELIDEDVIFFCIL